MREDINDPSHSLRPKKCFSEILQFTKNNPLLDDHEQIIFLLNNGNLNRVAFTAPRHPPKRAIESMRRLLPVLDECGTDTRWFL